MKATAVLIVIALFGIAIWSATLGSTASASPFSGIFASASSDSPHPVTSPFADIISASVEEPAQTNPPVHLPAAASNSQGEVSSQATAVATIIAQPTSVSVGQNISVSWTSLGMQNATPCAVLESGVQVAQGNSGTKQIVANTAGVIFLALQCNSLSGTLVSAVTFVNVQ